MIELTPSQNDYIKAIYTISLKGKVTVTSIADFLECSKPSVVRALKHLNDLNLIVYSSDITITNLGKRYAKNIIRRNNILEKFFTDVLKIDSELAKKEALNLKNGVSCYTISKLENYLFELFGEEVDNISDYCLCQSYHTCNK